MMKIDKAIFDTDKVICRNISRFDASERGLLSQNILSQLRNFVEYIADKIYSNGADIDPNNYVVNVAALSIYKLKVIFDFCLNFMSYFKSQFLTIHWMKMLQNV